MLIELKGDLFQGGGLNIIHGCNCFHVMGAGFAAEVRNRYPGAYDADRRTEWGTPWKVGSFSWYRHPRTGVTIYNAYTQHDYRNPPRSGVLVRYDGLLRSLVGIMRFHPIVKEFHMPRIGCGLAGGDWASVRGIMEWVASEYNRNFYVWSL